jgi:2-keto-4-pentenoate hydratase/2-oxohepta-3-ene-1,7-dioic acid hydratase in catechol pathway
MAWARLIRFVDDTGNTLFGEPCIESAEELSTKLEQGQLYALELKGKSPFELSDPGERVHVKSLVGVLNPEDVHAVKCIGLNYMKHSKKQSFLLLIYRRLTPRVVAEGGRKPPPYPSLFMKAPTCIASFDEDVPIHSIAQEKNLDYEGELVRNLE